MKTNAKKTSFRHSMMWLGLFSALLFAVLVLCTMHANAASVIESGNCGAQGDNVKWVLDSDGVLTISGKGAMKNYDDYGDETPPWYNIRGNIKKGIVKSGVTSIGDCAFYAHGSLTSVTIPNSVKSIGYNVFTWCFAFTSITIPNSVTSIGNYAFYACTALASVTIPNSVISIGNYAFYACHALSSVTISNGVTSIGDGAFGGCVALTSVTIPKSVTSIGEGAFAWCDTLTTITVSAANPNYASDKNGCLYDKNKTTLLQYPIGNRRITFTMPNSVTNIGECAFANGDFLTSVMIPNSVISIGEEAFANCDSFTSVTIPNSVTSIESRAFSFCSSLTSVTIPDSVTSIGERAFAWCDSLKTVKILNKQCEFDDFVFDDTPATIYGYKNSTTQAYAKEYDLKFVAICNHVYADTIYTKKATTTANGMTYKKCTKCGAAKRITTIYKVSTVKLSKTSYVYTGKARTPTPIVQDANGNNLKLNTDYKLKYSSGRKECGTYAVKVVFMGNYAGKKTLKFNIKLGKVTGITQQNSKGIYLTWNEVTGASRYEVWVYKEGYDKPKCMKSSTDTWIKKSNLTSGQVVKMQIRAVRVKADGTETYSAVMYTATAK
ncbi:MAG: leucine-rich repeat domain-containing protein [Clostridia bacterium]|nr:leucine-rich repeat domain-containing protein [Clostridia bacterium]